MTRITVAEARRRSFGWTLGTVVAILLLASLVVIALPFLLAVSA
jgi:hypothetical protein